MLILTRKRGECVDLSVGGQVIAVVKVMELLPGGVVRLGFEADQQVSISRDNIKERKDGNVAEDETRHNR
jgi:carbon storage regulator CsrA